MWVDPGPARFSSWLLPRAARSVSPHGKPSRPDTSQTSPQYRSDAGARHREAHPTCVRETPHNVWVVARNLSAALGLLRGPGGPGPGTGVALEMGGGATRLLRVACTRRACPPRDPCFPGLLRHTGGDSGDAGPLVAELTGASPWPTIISATPRGDLAGRRDRRAAHLLGDPPPHLLRQSAGCSEVSDCEDGDVRFTTHSEDACASGRMGQGCGVRRRGGDRDGRLAREEAGLLGLGGAWAEDQGASGQALAASGSWGRHVRDRVSGCGACTARAFLGGEGDDVGTPLIAASCPASKGQQPGRQCCCSRLRGLLTLSGASVAVDVSEGVPCTAWQRLEAQWWIAVGDQAERVGADAVVPAQDAFYEGEE